MLKERNSETAESKRYIMNKQRISVVILARGFGSRLGSVTKEIPKPMLPIGKYPFLAYPVAHYLSEGVGEVIIAAGWQGHVIKNYFSSDPWKDFPIRVIQNDPSGTGSDLVKTASEARGDKILMLGGDLIVEFSFDDLISKHEAAAQPHCTFVVSKWSPQNQGAFHVDRKDNLVYSDEAKSIPHGLEILKGEKPEVVLRTSSTGAALMEVDYLKSLKAKPLLSIEADLIPELINQKQIKVFGIDGFFFEFGLPDRYLSISQRPEKVEAVYGDPFTRLSKIQTIRIEEASS